jgi:hypothetical protein
MKGRCDGMSDVLCPYLLRPGYIRMWHSTHHECIPAIMKNGLLPRSGSCGDGYGGRLCWDECIFLWPYPGLAWGWADQEIEVVLEVIIPETTVLYLDPARKIDCEMSNSLFIRDMIPPENIIGEVWPHCPWPEDHIWNRRKL